jgi:hypothetical protein
VRVPTIPATHSERRRPRVTSHIPDRGQVIVRYYGVYTKAHRGKVGKADRVPVALGMIEEEPRPVPSKGWVEMIRKVDEVDPLVCPRCGGRMRVVAFLTEYAASTGSSVTWS